MKALIIGGGIMGTSLALELHHHGLEVTVLERAIPGAEASAAAAGMLAPQLEAQGPGPVLELGLRSRGLYPSWVKGLEEKSGLHVDYLPSGVLVAALSEAEAQELEATVAWQTAFGLRAELLGADEARAHEPALTARAVAAALFPDDHQVDPVKLMKALSIAAARSGVWFRTGTVRSLVEEAGRAVGVDVDGEVLRADVVVLAAGAWTGLLNGAHLNAHLVRPVRGQMVELSTRLPPSRRILKCKTGYLVPRPDGRVLVGSTMEHVGYDKSVTAEGLGKLLTGAQLLVPALKDAAVTRTWAGLRPWTEDGLPVLGEGPLKGLFLASGHFRNGILHAPITARLLGQVIRGESPIVDLNPFRYNRFQS